MADHRGLAFEHRPEAVVALLSGDLDLSNVAETERAILDKVAPGAHLIVDLSRLRHLDSSGLALLDRLAARHRDERIRFVVPEGALYRRVLEIVSFTETLPLAVSVDEAVASFTAAA